MLSLLHAGWVFKATNLEIFVTNILQDRDSHLGGGFDAVFDNDVLKYLPQSHRLNFIKILKTNMKPGAFALITSFNNCIEAEITNILSLIGAVAGVRSLKTKQMRADPSEAAFCIQF